MSPPFRLATSLTDALPSQITIKRIERNKRKYVTTVLGLESFGIDLKKAAKLFAQKFATGASVTKNPQGLDDITVQGDVSDEIVSRGFPQHFGLQS